VPEAYWFWICPVLISVGISRAKRRAWVVVEDERVKVGGKIIILWIEVESLAKRGWMRVVFVLKEGRMKSLWTSDWSTESKKEGSSSLRVARRRPRINESSVRGIELQSGRRLRTAARMACRFRGGTG
jgi:hypothetical protein